MRRLQRVAMVATAVVATLTLAPAAHAGDQLGLSWNGQQWSDHLNGSLFDSDELWVPGEQRIASFHVRNQGPDGATLSVAVDSGDQQRLVTDGDIGLSARIAGGQWVPMQELGTTYQLQTAALRPGDETRVDVRANFAAEATNQTQSKHVALAFAVTLTEKNQSTGPGTDPNHHDNNNSDGELPNTGAPAVGGLLAVAAMAVGLGFALVRRTRENEDV